jgi:transcriptional regulator GlxA family with amidase domain
MYYLAQLDIKNNIAYTDPPFCSDLISLPLPNFSNIDICAPEDALIEMARNVLDELVHSPNDLIPVRKSDRRKIALKVEKLIWQIPDIRNCDEDINLTDLAKLLGISRRTIQLALQEEFGVGFVTLRKTIRLYQLRSDIVIGKGRNISDIATGYFFSHFGRLSGQYKSFFGYLPSKEFRALIKSRI